MTKSSVLLAYAWLCTLLTLSQSGRAASDEVERYLGESSTMPTLLSLTGTDYTSPSTFDAFSRNQYAYAREDAAAYTASDGQIHGVQLERAWRDYLTTRPVPRMSQDAFAVEVLAWSAE